MNEIKTIKNSGITLIALVITIIVLLILAGVTIATVTDNNGVLNNVSYAKFSTEIRNIQEQLELKEIKENYNDSGTIEEVLGINSSYNDFLYVENGVLVYIPSKINEKQKKWLIELGIEVQSNYYKVEFDSAGGTEVAVQEIKEGSKVKKPNDPKKEGYEFIGWYYLKPTGSGENISYEELEFDFDTSIMENYSLYAKYKGEAVMRKYRSTDCFWQYRDSIKHIIFTSDNSKILRNYDYSWNIRENDNCADIMAYLEMENGNLVIFSNYTIYANPDSTSYFFGFTNLENIEFENFDTSKTQSMASMFNQCISLTELDLSSFNTKNAINMQYMFRDCNNLIQVQLANFNVEKVENMERMFQRCYVLKNLNLEGFDTPDLKAMSFMFENCNSLTELKLGNLKTDNVINMECVFSGCNSLLELNLTSFNTENVTNMQSMFLNCKSLEKLDLSNFKTENVTNMQSMFCNCINLKELNVSGFDTKNVTSMLYMFRDCNSLKSLDLNSFTTTNVTNMQRMFQRCSSLEILNIKNFDMTNVSDFTYMLDGVNNNIIIKTNDNMKTFIDTNFSKYSTNVEV